MRAGAGAEPGVAVSTGSFYDLDIPTEDAIGHIADMGVGDAEVFLQSPAEAEPAFVRDLARRCEASGVRVGSVHPYVFGFENLLYTVYSRQREWATDQYRRYLDVCAELGAPHYVCHGPPRHHAMRGGRLGDAYRERTAALADLAARRGVVYCMENVSYGLVSDVDDMEAHLRGLDVPFVLDFKSAWKAGPGPEPFIDRFGDRLLFAHVSFNDRPGGRFGVCAPGGALGPEEASALRAFRSGAANPRMVLELCEASSVADVAMSVEAVRCWVECAQRSEQ